MVVERWLDGDLGEPGPGRRCGDYWQPVLGWVSSGTGKPTCGGNTFHRAVGIGGAVVLQRELQQGIPACAIWWMVELPTGCIAELAAASAQAVVWDAPGQSHERGLEQ